MSVTKTGVWTSANFHENYGSYNPITAFNSGYNSGTYTKSGSSYTITSAVTTSTWGSGVSIPQGALYVPYGYTYRVTFDAYMSTAHNIKIDINNTRADGGSNWAGNDNDTGRTAIDFSIPANTWTTVTWGGSNTHSSNTDQVALLVYDGIGLVTSGDSTSTSWTMRNPRFIVYKDTQTNASVDSTTVHSYQFIEY